MNIILTKNFESELNDLPFIDYVKDKIKNAIFKYFKTKYISDYDIFIDDDNIEMIKNIIEDLEIEIDNKKFILTLFTNYLRLKIINNYETKVECPYCKSKRYYSYLYYENMDFNYDSNLEQEHICEKCNKIFYIEYKIELIKVKE